MGSNSSVTRRRAAAVWFAVVLATALAIPAVAFATPTAPVVRDAVLKQGGVGVQLWWSPSTDTEAGTLVYSVYRANVPMTLATYAGKEFVTSTNPLGPGTWVGETTVTVTPAAAEATTKFTYYYLVEVRNLTTGKNAISANIVPNVHGPARTGFQTFNCQLCHSVHGAAPQNSLGAATRYKCYRCHGATDAATDYGAAAVKNVQREFYDYDGQPGGTTASKHFNAKNVADERECTMCHFKYPHGSPYYVDPLTAAYDATKSYAQLLSVKRSDATYFSSKDSAPAGNAFCLECHGVSTTTLDYNAGAGSYDRQAGDHTYAANAAHNASGVKTNGLGTNPGIQCEACHNKHASAADKLIAYRGDDTRGADLASGTYAQAELCYACHSAAGATAELAAGTAVGDTNLAWNKRDVKAQFAKASKHPTVARTGIEPATSGVWTQTTDVDFASDALANAVITGGTGAAARVELARVGGAAPGIFSDNFASGDFSQWTTAGTYWQIDAASGNTLGGGSGAPSARGYATSTTIRTAYLTRAVNLAGRTNVRLTFAYRTVGIEAGDVLNAQYTTNGTTWTTLMTVSTVAPWTQSGSYAVPATATQIRFTSTVNATTEYVYVDDVALTADPIPFTYQNVGTVVSTPIASASGPLGSWTSLSFAATQPAGSTLSIDVLDAATNVELMSNLTLAATQPIPLSISAVDHPTLKLRAELAGDAASPASVVDDFNHAPDDPATNFDTVKWVDARLNGSTDPDSGAPVTTSLFSDGFESGLVPPWDAANMTRTTTNPHTGTYAAGHTYGGSGVRETRTADKDIDLTGVTNPTLQFWYRHGTFSSTTDYVRAYYSTNGGGAWTQLWTSTWTASRAWTQTAAIALPAGTNAIRLAASVNGTAENAYFDDVVVSGDVAGTPTDDWPKEVGGTLQLRAEGTAFGGTADEGEFTYVSPAVASWVMTDDFNLQVRVPAISNLAGGAMRAGLMIRTASSEANALLANSAMAGVYVTNTNIAFQYRAAGGGTAAAATTVAGSAPEWLRLERRGSVITAKTSNDGVTWTTVGNGTLTMGNTVLVGMGITSTVSNTFSEATYDDFSVTGTAPPSTVTPALLDWSVAYTHYPLPTTGSLTCVNCHNVHLVQPGSADEAAAANWWNVARVSDPGNTTLAYAGSTTAFCLECHNYSQTPIAAEPTRNALVPYSAKFSASTSPLFVGWDKGEAGFSFTNSGHYAATAANGQALCENCHDPHASDNDRLTAWTRPLNTTWAGGFSRAGMRANDVASASEERLCYNCHGNGTAAYPRSNGARDVYTDVNATYKHGQGTLGTPGAHSDIEPASTLPVSSANATRHSECSDCHDPHVAKGTVNGTSPVHTQGSSVAGGALYGAFGLNPNYPQHTSTSSDAGNWTAPASSTFTAIRLNGASGDFEAYLCFKCHNAAQNVIGTKTYTNQVLEFNPSNFSEHNVLGQTMGMETAFTVGGTSYTWSKPADTAFLKAGWTSNSPVTCTDCHTGEGNADPTTQARGPHGSSVAWLIDPDYPSDWKTTYLNGTNMSNTTNICAKCHQNLSNANGTHSEGNHQGSGDGNCNTCHIRIPHGWKRPRLIGYTTDDPAYRTVGGLNGMALKSEAYNNYDTPDCATSGSCSHGSHEYTGASW